MEDKEGALFLEKYYLLGSEDSSDPLRFLEEAKKAATSLVLIFEEVNKKEIPLFKKLVEKHKVHVKVLEALIKKKSL